MKDRSSEELDAILQSFPDVFKMQFGKPLDISRMEAVLLELLKERELEVIRQRFFDFSAKNIRDCLEKLQPPEIKNVKKAKSKP